jgi:hypothetical protein
MKAPGLRKTPNPGAERLAWLSAAGSPPLARAHEAAAAEPISFRHSRRFIAFSGCPLRIYRFGP